MQVASMHFHQRASRALEDVHMNVEARLRDRIGPVAGRLHTGRSRNDQVATDARLWTVEACGRLETVLGELQHVMLRQAEQLTEAILPA